MLDWLWMRNKISELRIKRVKSKILKRVGNEKNGADLYVRSFFIKQSYGNTGSIWTAAQRLPFLYGIIYSLRNSQRLRMFRRLSMVHG